jgi:hypothetical protein
LNGEVTVVDVEEYVANGLDLDPRRGCAAGVAEVSAEDWPTVGWSVMSAGIVLLIVWFWLRDRRR